MRRVDVAIVGAGPAGSASALFLSEHGLEVLLVDRARFPRDKVCGEALSPGAVPYLDTFGIKADVERQGAFPYRGARLATPDGLQAEARYPGTHAGLAIARECLDWLLLQRAATRVEIRQETSVDAVDRQREGYQLTLKHRGKTETVWARAVVSAEGRFGRILGETVRESGPARRFAVVASLEGVRGLDDMLEFHLIDPTLQVVVSAQSPDRAAIAVVLDGPDASNRAPGAIKDFLGLLGHDPLLADRLDRARLVKPPRGMGLGRYRPSQLVGDACLMVGDAVGYMDPITGEGMFRAFRTAQLASKTLAEGFSTGDLSARRLQGYATSVRSEFEPCYRFVDTVVALSRRPKVARLALRAIARDPVLATRMGAYQGALAPAAGFFSLSTLGRLAWAGAQAMVCR